MDVRIDAVRPDLADLRLAERVFAPHYASAMPQVAGRAATIVTADGEILSEVLAGEPFEVLEVTTDRVWGVSPIDGAVGYAPRDAFAAPGSASHSVALREAALLARPTPDADVLAMLPMGARLVAADAAGAMVEVDGGYVAADALVALSASADDPATFAERLLGAPYRAGGRSGLGVDPAGLIFLCHLLCGIEVPRFLDLQMETLGHALPVAAGPARGDVLFTADGVALAVDDASAVRVTVGGIVQQVAPADLGTIVARRRAA